MSAVIAGHLVDRDACDPDLSPQPPSVSSGQVHSRADPQHPGDVFPLCVDLDGTLIKTDLLIESLLCLLKRNPLFIFLAVFWLCKGKANLKQNIALRVDLDVTLLPYNQRLLEFIHQEQSRGRPIFLATACHRKYANQVSTHLGIFNGVLATENDLNLSGKRKLAQLRSMFGKAGFDYAGNDKADLPIWREARKAVIVDATPRVRREAEKNSAINIAFQDKGSYFRSLAKALRLHQWLKNCLVFVPLVTAHLLGNSVADIRAVLAFLAFCLCASSVYLLNDLLDLSADRRHLQKRERAFASGKIPLIHGVILIPILLAAAIVISIWLPAIFLGVLGVYYVSTLIYSFWAKQTVVLDIILLAGLYTLRILAGAAAILVIPSFWLLAFSMFIFLSLALVKRYSEMLAMLRAGDQKAVGRGYVVSDMSLLQSIGTASGYMSVLVVALYINSPEVHQHYQAPYFLWMICPLLLFWITRVWIKTHRGEMHSDPVVFAATDKVSLMMGLVAVLGIALGSIF